MIVVPEDGERLVITQHDHARLAGELLSLWRAGGLPEHPRRGEILFATREHDNGWREADSAPRVDPSTGRPHDFTSVPLAVRAEVWLRGAARYAESWPYGALLVTWHALELHRDHRGDEAWEEELLAPLEELLAELLKRTGAPREEVRADSRWLALADGLSLAACNRWTQPTESDGHRFAFRPGGGGTHGGQPVDGELWLKPFPLAGATTFRVACRRVPDRPYAGDADLGGELAAARWAALRIRVRPAEPASPA
jgi:hypothetical protein